MTTTTSNLTPRSTPSPRVVTFGVVTPTLNADRFLEGTLRSIWAQPSERILVDHVIVDGGSTDRTVEIAERYPSRVVVATDDTGMYDAINRGLNMVRGEIIGYLNADYELSPGALDVVAGAFLDHPEAQWLMGRRDYIDAEGTPFATMQPVGFTLREYLGLGWSCVPQETVWMRRSFWERVGPYDVTFRNTGDYDMFARARRAARPLILHDTIGRFRLHDAQLSRRPEVMQRESQRVREKNGSIDVLGWVLGRFLSARLNFRNPRWLVAKKTGKIRFTQD